MVIEKLEHSRLKVVFDVSVEEWKKTLDKAFEICNAKVTIKGFRKGKAPRSIYDKNYGEESLYDEALNIIFNEKAKEVYRDPDLAKEICGPFEPNVEGTVDLKNKGDFKISLTFDVYPEVNLPQYKGLEVPAKVLEVTEEELKKEIDGLLKKDAERVLKEEQVIEEGDYAIFDFVGSVDGVEFEGGKAENYELQIGSKQFIPGFEDQMIGMKAEEVKDVHVTFPEEYGEKSLAGKAAVFKVTVHEVKKEMLPEFNDEYVANLKLDGIATVEEWKANKKAELEKKKAVDEKDRQVDQLINKVLDNAVVDMPKSLIDDKVNALRQQYEQQAKMYNIPFEMYLSLMNITKEVFEDHIQKQGQRQALFQVVAQKIIDVENLAPSQEAMEAKAEEEAKATNKNKDEVLRNNIRRYYSDMCYQALVDLLLNNAVEV